VKPVPAAARATLIIATALCLLFTASLRDTAPRYASRLSPMPLPLPAAERQARGGSGST
jgi:hypothetical protein